MGLFVRRKVLETLLAEPLTFTPIGEHRSTTIFGQSALHNRARSRQAVPPMTGGLRSVEVSGPHHRTRLRALEPAASRAVVGIETAFVRPLGRVLRRQLCVPRADTRYSLGDHLTLHNIDYRTLLSGIFSVFLSEGDNPARARCLSDERRDDSSVRGVEITCELSQLRRGPLPDILSLDIEDSDNLSARRPSIEMSARDSLSGPRGETSEHGGCHQSHASAPPACWPRTRSTSRFTSAGRLESRHSFSFSRSHASTCVPVSESAVINSDTRIVDVR